MNGKHAGISHTSLAAPGTLFEQPGCESIKLTYADFRFCIGGWLRGFLFFLHVLLSTLGPVACRQSAYLMAY